jgi:hypothetical protein
LDGTARKQRTFWNAQHEPSLPSYLDPQIYVQQLARASSKRTTTTALALLTPAEIISRMDNRLVGKPHFYQYSLFDNFGFQRADT